jgi:chemotaxis protein methyltransferase CheR
MPIDPTNYKLDSKSFEAIADLAYRESGLQLVAEKSSMIQSRLRHRLRAVGIDDFTRYASLVCSEDGVPERRQMISALTTNVSHFFRENHHFDIFAQKILPSAIDRIRSGDRFRVWSAGCSNGQEAYSVAMTALEAFPELAELDFKILATDIDPNVVTFAARGIYPERLVSGIPAPLLSKYFSMSTSEKEDPEYTISEHLKSLVTFKELNLLAEWPMKQKLDAIFCRNVVIYFDLKTQNKLWPRFHQQLTPDGYLFLGHSERIGVPDLAGFKNVGPTSYRPTSVS